jgi:muramidase (phage lysozyme)
LHAVGRYQFIGDTFARVVRGMKLPPDTQFTPEIQDQMAVWLIRRDGWRGVWIGPTDHATYAERQALDKLARSRG